MPRVSFGAGLDYRLEKSHLMSKPSAYHEVWLVHNSMGFSETPKFYLVSLSAPIVQYTDTWSQTNSGHSFAFLLPFPAFSIPDGTCGYHNIIQHNSWTLDLRSSEKHL